MLNSTNIILSFFASVIVVTSGCLGTPEKETDECENQTFIIDEIKEGELFISEESALPEKFTLKLKACIRAYEKIETKLPHTFWAISRNKQILKTVDNFKNEKKAKASTVLSTNKDEIIKTTADGTGCISWEEEYNYAHNDQSEWIILERHIRGISSQRPGVCTIPLAVNPWLQLEKNKNIQVADYRDRYTRNNPIINKRIKKNINGLSYLKQKKEEERQNKVDIIIDPLQLNTDNTISTKETQRVFQNTIIAKLTYKIRDIHGALQSNAVTQGDFVIEPTLLINERTTQGDNITEDFMKINANNSVPVQTDFSDKQLTSDAFQWTTPFERHHSQIKLYLKVTPLGGTAQRINPFEGIYRIGNRLDKLLSNNTLTLPLNDILRIKYDNKILEKSENTFSNKANPDPVALNECLKNRPGNQVYKCISLDKTLEESSRGALRAGWLVGDLDIRFFQMKKENWLFREITSLIKTNISDRSLGTIGKEPITIEVLDLNSGTLDTISKRTQDNGNISFNITTQQKWYKKQKYFLKRIRFYTNTKELKSEKIIAINPWDYGFTHGYEVDQADDIRATCLTDTTQDKTKVKNLLLKTNQHFTPDEIETIQKMFCYNPSETTYPINSQVTFLSWDKTFNLFKETLNPLFDPPLNTRNNPAEIFYHKFTSVNKVKLPESYIHLFRSINKYPTPIIDSSLTREVYYNIRFKLTPRVVRHDDVPRGQQNKGPLRDGVYIFQMAVLKNDQGKFSGRTAMVQSKAQFKPDPYIDTPLSSTLPLFSCPINQKDCVKIEDFIIPPRNIPIIIKDGMVKVDIPIHIRSEHLLFADSKNLIVFRILPADPKSIVCQENFHEPLECTLNTIKEGKVIYSSAFDWNKTNQQITTANPHDYDMFFHTYKTPFIPSIWANWNITHELDIPFDDLAEHYEYLKVNELLNQKLKYWKEIESFTEEKQERETSTSNNSELSNFIALRDEINTLQNLSNVTQTKIEENKVEIETISNDIEKKLLESETKTEQDSELTADLKAATLEKIKEMRKELEETQFLASLLVSAKITSLTETERGVHDPEAIPTNQARNTSANGACIGTINYSTPFSGSTNNCLVNKKEEEDLSEKHISYFASQNNLCTMHVNSDFPLNQKNCGQFSTPEEAQQSFVDDLNRQIELLNKDRERIRELYQRMTKSPQSAFPTIENTQKEPPEKPIEEAFQREHRNSRVVANKLKNLPHLPLLNTDNLENIILSDINDNTIRDQNTATFLHALCGFWFENFFSSKYTNEELLLGGLRNSIKQSFYYKVRDISTLPHERDNILMQNFKAGLEEMKKNYDDYLSDQNLKGNIDDLHKWVNNEEGYGFDSPFDQKLRDRFQSISINTPLSGTKPSWVDRDESTSHNTFKTQDYLDEAINAAKKIGTGFAAIHTLRYKDDNHPFRKCIMNPSHFFGFEKKIIIGKVNNSMKYGSANKSGGEITTLNISEAFLMNTQRDQGANQQFELGSNLTFLSLPFLAYGLIGGLIPSLLRVAKIGHSALKKPVMNLGSDLKNIFNSSVPLKHFLLPAVSGTALAFSGIIGSYAYRTYEGTGKRRWLSVQVVETVELIAEHTPILVGLKNYHECLVIRPRFSAFESHTDKYDHIWAEENQVLRSIYEKAGILLCTQGKKENSFIQEDYYYIYPNYAINGITIDPKSHRNKPFAISLRGTKEYKRFLHNLSCHVSETTEPVKNNMDCRDTRGEYENLFLKHIEFARNLRQGFDTPKMFHLTSDAPGVHSPYKEPEDRKPRANTNAVHDLINWFTGFQFMDMDLEKIIKKEPE